MQQDIKSLTKEELCSWLEKNDIKPFRTDQILKWIYLHQTDNFEMMTNISKDLRKFLSKSFINKRLKKEKVLTSPDNTSKYLFCLEDGNHIETVLIPERDHYTLCISTQVGCAQGCKFCLTASGGFIRNLTHAEIVSQVRDIQFELQQENKYNKPLSNIVLMGMGEPLANYENVIKAINIITDSDFGLGFSNRRVTLSTVGLVPKLYKLGRDSKIKLAVSLNATDNKTRDMLMPINKKYPIERLIEALKEYPLQTRKRITFEYILIEGINDSEKNAKELARLLRPLRAKINLIPFNEHCQSKFKCPKESVILDFQKILIKNHYTAIIRKSKGQSISAACGQLSFQRLQHKVISSF